MQAQRTAIQPAAEQLIHRQNQVAHLCVPELLVVENLLRQEFKNCIFFDFGLPQHKTLLVNSLRGNVLKLALQMYGCRVIQKVWLPSYFESLSGKFIDSLKIF